MTPDPHRRRRNASIALTDEEYELIYGMAAIGDYAVSARGRDILIADALRRRNAMS